MSTTSVARHDPYEEIPYIGVSDSRSHVACLEALATMFGVAPADIRQCRVLELGCASGRNVIPQAEALPQSAFIGIDTCADQLGAARADVAALGFNNVDLRPVSIEAVDASWGLFDYILCPGVFSWVDAAMRQRILDICRQNLAPQGVAFVSFNAKPGWSIQSVVRDLLRYHVALFDDPRRRLAEARRLLEFIAENCPNDSLQGRLFQGERDFLRGVRDDYLYHDYLVDQNEPLYLHEFVRLAETHGLQFLCDADIAKMSGTFTPSAVQAVLAKTPPIQRYQLLDFLRNETFHRVLLCRRDTVLPHAPAADAIGRFHVRLVALPQPVEIAVGDGQPLGFAFRPGTLTTSAPLGKAALEHLIRSWPATVSLETLHAAAKTRLQVETTLTEQDRMPDFKMLMHSAAALFQAGLLRLYLHPPQFQIQSGARPRAAAFARRLAARQTYVTSQLHENVTLDALQSLVLSQLDGQKDRAALLELLHGLVAAGGLKFDPAAGTLAEQLEKTLEKLGRWALLL